MRLNRCLYYAPSRTPDGEGGWTAGYDDPVVSYAAVILHQGETWITVRQETVCDMEAIFKMDEGYYRIIATQSAGGAPMKRLLVERCQKPITPSGA